MGGYDALVEYLGDTDDLWSSEDIRMTRSGLELITELMGDEMVAIQRLSEFVSDGKSQFESFDELIMWSRRNRTIASKDMSAFVQYLSDSTLFDDAEEGDLVITKKGITALLRQFDSLKEAVSLCKKMDEEGVRLEHFDDLVKAVEENIHPPAYVQLDYKKHRKILLTYFNEECDLFDEIPDDEELAITSKGLDALITSCAGSEKLLTILRDLDNAGQRFDYFEDLQPAVEAYHGNGGLSPRKRAVQFNEGVAVKEIPARRIITKEDRHAIIECFDNTDLFEHANEIAATTRGIDSLIELWDGADNVMSALMKLDKYNVRVNTFEGLLSACTPEGLAQWKATYEKQQALQARLEQEKEDKRLAEQERQQREAELRQEAARKEQEREEARLLEVERVNAQQARDREEAEAQARIAKEKQEEEAEAARQQAAQELQEREDMAAQERAAQETRQRVAEQAAGELEAAEARVIEREQEQARQNEEAERAAEEQRMKLEQEKFEAERYEQAEQERLRQGRMAQQKQAEAERAAEEVRLREEREAAGRHAELAVKQKAIQDAKDREVAAELLAKQQIETENRAAQTIQLQFRYHGKRKAKHEAEMMKAKEEADKKLAEENFAALTIQTRYRYHDRSRVKRNLKEQQLAQEALEKEKLAAAARAKAQREDERRAVEAKIAKEARKAELARIRAERDEARARQQAGIARLAQQQAEAEANAQKALEREAELRKQSQEQAEQLKQERRQRRNEKIMAERAATEKKRSEEEAEFALQQLQMIEEAASAEDALARQQREEKARMAIAAKEEDERAERERALLEERLKSEKAARLQRELDAATLRNKKLFEAAQAKQNSREDDEEDDMIKRATTATVQRQYAAAIREKKERELISKQRDRLNGDSYSLMSEMKKHEQLENDVQQLEMQDRSIISQKESDLDELLLWTEQRRALKQKDGENAISGKPMAGRRPSVVVDGLAQHVYRLRDELDKQTAVKQQEQDHVLSLLSQLQEELAKTVTREEELASEVTKLRAELHSPRKHYDDTASMDQLSILQDLKREQHKLLRILSKQQKAETLSLSSRVRDVDNQSIAESLRDLEKQRENLLRSEAALGEFRKHGKKKQAKKLQTFTEATSRVSPPAYRTPLRHSSNTTPGSLRSRAMTMQPNASPHIPQAPQVPQMTNPFSSFNEYMQAPPHVSPQANYQQVYQPPQMLHPQYAHSAQMYPQQNIVYQHPHEPPVQVVAPMQAHVPMMSPRREYPRYVSASNPSPRVQRYVQQRNEEHRRQQYKEPVVTIASNPYDIMYY